MGRNLNLNLFLFYNDYKLGRMPLFIWSLNISNRREGGEGGGVLLPR